MFCPYCGMSNADDAKFCGGCGANLVQETVHNTYNEPVSSQVDTQPTYSQPTYEQPAYNQYANYVPEKKSDGKGLAIAGMVCGIVSIFLFAIILGPLGIIFGVVAKSKGYKGGMATAGIVCGAVGLVLMVLVFIGLNALLSDLSYLLYY